MSVTVDTNVLVYASNMGDAAHDDAQRLLERLTNGGDLLYLSWSALMGYVRIVTHPRDLAYTALAIGSHFERRAAR